MRQNLGWAVGYNLLGLPIAAGALYPTLPHSAESDRCLGSDGSFQHFRPVQLAAPAALPITSTIVMMISAELARKATVLDATLASLGSVLVAYSGGTDSAFLAWASHRALGNRMLAVIADSASLPRAELAQALAFTAAHAIPTHILATSELDKPDYIRNDARRCFHCKDTLFAAMEQERSARNFDHLAYGMNLDDKNEFRPGQQAAAMHHAVAPAGHGSTE